MTRPSSEQADLASERPGGRCSDCLEVQVGCKPLSALTDPASGLQWGPGWYNPTDAMIRLFLIAALVLQPWLVPAVGRPCRTLEAGRAEVCCAVRACCGSTARDQRHHCGQEAALCRCGESSSEEPQTPGPQRSGPTEVQLALLAGAIVISGEPVVPSRGWRLPAAGPDLRGSAHEQRAVLCIWMT